MMPSPDLDPPALCRCRSFSQNTKTNACRVCGHETHNDRVQCGRAS